MGCPAPVQSGTRAGVIGMERRIKKMKNNQHDKSAALYDMYLYINPFACWSFFFFLVLSYEMLLCQIGPFGCAILRSLLGSCERHWFDADHSRSQHEILKGFVWQKWKPDVAQGALRTFDNSISTFHHIPFDSRTLQSSYASNKTNQLGDICSQLLILLSPQSQPWAFRKVTLTVASNTIRRIEKGCIDFNNVGEPPVASR